MRSKRRRADAAVLLGGVPGVPAAEVVVLGGGVSGTHAATIALGMGANVTVVDKSSEALRRLSAQFGTGVRTIYSTRAAIAELVTRADLVIGARAGARRRRAEARHPRDAQDDEAGRGDRRRRHRPGRLLRDVASATTHSDPTYVVDGVVHYCVANMPGAVARTSTFALNNATLPFALALADKGWRQALKDDPHLRAGLNVHDGKITCKPVADAHGLPYTPAESVLG